jgi:lipopolysaccharide heptosyltransferase I
MKILIIKLSSIGDLVHGIPAYQALKRNLIKEYPNVKIDWLVYESLAPSLFQSIKKENLVILPNRKFTTLIRKASELKNQYDYVIDLQGLFKTALISKMIAPNSNYGFKLPRETWAHYFYKNSFCDYKSIESKKHVIDQNLELIGSFLNELNYNRGELDLSIDFGLTTQEYKKKEKKQCCFIPATTWESKHWALENWTDLIQNLDENQYDFFITGSPQNQNYLQQIQDSVSKKINLVTNKKLEDLFHFYQGMDLIIGVDTGPLHIAAASLFPQKKDKKIIGLYGPSSGSRSGPYGFKAISVDEIFGLKASNKKTKLKDHNSINKISPDMVYQQVTV